jgi:flavin-dependent dehydrogenase
MGVIDSFSGDGMSIALHSAALAASALVSGAGADGYHRHMRADIAGQIGRARRLYYFGQDHGRTLMRLAAIWPGALRWAARWTRVPERALARALA